MKGTPPAPGTVVEIDKKEGVLVLEVVWADEERVQYRASWRPETVATPRLVEPVLLADWLYWTRKGRKGIRVIPPVSTTGS